MNFVLDDIESKKVKFHRCCNGIVLMQEKVLIPRRFMLSYLRMKYDVCNLLSNDSAKNYIGRWLGDRKKANVAKCKQLMDLNFHLSFWF